MVDVASGDHRLLSIRSRGSENRRFARVEDLLRTGQARYRAEEADAQAKIDKVDSTIAEILKTTKARSLADLPQEVRTKIAQLYADTIPVRKRQREIRRSMREEVERLGQILTSLNLASGPALALMLWGLARFSRRRSLPRTAQATSPELEEKTRAALEQLRLLLPAQTTPKTRSIAPAAMIKPIATIGQDRLLDLLVLRQS